MKKLVLLIFTCLSFGQVIHGQVTGILPTREVLPEAVKLWEACFAEIKNEALISPSTDDLAEFSSSLLLRLYDSISFGNSSDRIIIFRYYLYDNQSLNLALTIPEDTTKFLIPDSYDLVPYDYFTPNDTINFFNDWKKFTQKSESLIYVSEYRYNWSNFLGHLEKNDSLTVKQVAHTVSPFDILYDVPYECNKEGYIAVDILLTGIDENGTPTDLDFAMPCPRNCPR